MRAGYVLELWSWTQSSILFMVETIEICVNIILFNIRLYAYLCRCLCVGGACFSKIQRLGNLALGRNIYNCYLGKQKKCVARSNANKFQQIVETDQIHSKRKKNKWIVQHVTRANLFFHTMLFVASILLKIFFPFFFFWSKTELKKWRIDSQTKSYWF